jgi:hypothetical protein
MVITVISDNEWIASEVQNIISSHGDLCGLIMGIPNWDNVNGDLLISAHCKTIFPKHILERFRCVNIHPGLLPHGRGMFPHVWDMIFGRPTGCTIHEMTEHIDCGNIIVQREVPIFAYDTSKDVYERIVFEEMRLFDDNYKLITMGKRPLYRSRKDFDALCELNLDDCDALRGHIELLRALSHAEHHNAYFRDENGRKIYVQLKLTPE